MPVYVFSLIIRIANTAHRSLNNVYYNIHDVVAVVTIVMIITIMIIVLIIIDHGVPIRKSIKFVCL